MPIVDVHFVLPPMSAMPDGAASRLANALGTALGCKPGDLWLRLHALPASQYAENAPPEQTPELPVFVTVLRAHLKPGPELRAEALALAQVVAETLSMPRTRVHIEFAPPGAGRVAFGGDLVQ